MSPPPRGLLRVDHRTRADVSCTGVVVVCPCGFRVSAPTRAAARADQIAHEAQYRPRKRTPAYAAARRATARANGAT